MGIVSVIVRAPKDCFFILNLPGRTEGLCVRMKQGDTVQITGLDEEMNPVHLSKVEWLELPEV